LVGNDRFIEGQLVSTSGGLVGNRFTISTDTTSLLAPDVIFDGTQYLVVWCKPWASDRLVCGQFVDTGGSLIGGNFVVSDEGTTYRREDPAVAASDINYLVAWDEYRASLTSDLYGNIDLVIGVDEDINNRSLSSDLPCATIFAGPLVLPAGNKCKLFDITGRIVAPDKLKPGVYFIEIDGRIARKVVKIR
jgi:hypothetical protein